MEHINTAAVREAFHHYIHGHHALNRAPIKESRWEDANVDILRAGAAGAGPILAAAGSHESGCDIRTKHFALSNKTCKIRGPQGRGRIHISSYRLSGVCNARDIGDIADILAETTRRGESFDYYSILARRSVAGGGLEYIWYLVPKTADFMNPATYEWEPMYRAGAGAGDEIMGYHTVGGRAAMEIRFACSSQLWIKVPERKLEHYVVARTFVLPHTCHKMSYIDIGRALAPTQPPKQRGILDYFFKKPT